MLGVPVSSKVLKLPPTYWANCLIVIFVLARHIDQFLSPGLSGRCFSGMSGSGTVQVIAPTRHGPAGRRVWPCRYPGGLGLSSLAFFARASAKESPTDNKGTRQYLQIDPGSAHMPPCGL